MDFLPIASLYLDLEQTSKRLLKVHILRDFILSHREISPLLLDTIVGNTQRSLDKKRLGISYKTLINVLSFVSQKSTREIDSLFHKHGDVGIVAELSLTQSKQASLFSSSSLTFEEIISTLKKISSLSGKDSQKRKEELLSQLFLKATTSQEYRFLARMLLDDLRIGTSLGVVLEACVNVLFPKILGIHTICSQCRYVSINQKTCPNCSHTISLEEQEEKFSQQYEILEIAQNFQGGLCKFVPVRSQEEQIKFILRKDAKKYVLKTYDPRFFYNSFTKLVEQKYHVINSFEKLLKPAFHNLLSLLIVEIELGTPLKSMLGTRASSITQAKEDIGATRYLLDYKYDGLRVQIHNNYGEVHLFSRNLEDITSQFPEVVDYIKNNFLDFSFVLDSECIAYDFQAMKCLEFQELSRRILSKNIREVSHIKVAVKIFDLMYFQGETLLSLPYEKRREKMYELLLNKPLLQSFSFDIEKLKTLSLNQQ